MLTKSNLKFFQACFVNNVYNMNKISKRKIYTRVWPAIRPNTGYWNYQADYPVLLDIRPCSTEVIRSVIRQFQCLLFQTKLTLSDRISGPTIICTYIALYKHFAKQTNKHGNTICCTMSNYTQDENHLWG